MATQKDFLGFVDTGGKIRRAPLVGMELLHQRAVRSGDVVGARAGLQTKDLIGLLLRHLAAKKPRAALPCHLARLHASGAPGGQDTPSITPGFPRRNRRAARPASQRRGDPAPRPCDGRKRSFRAFRRCRDRAPFREKANARARPAPCSCRCDRKNRPDRTVASRGALARTRRAEWRCRFRRAGTRTPPRRSRGCRRTL